MARVIWKGNISFGLVSIPMRLYGATQTKKLNFRLVDRRDHSPIGYQKVNKTTGEEVDEEHIGRAFETEDGELILLDEEDFDDAAPGAVDSVDILDFVDEESVDPVYYDKPYVMVPGESAHKSYALLRHVIERSGHIGVAKVVLRSREHLAAVRVHGDALVLDLMRFGHELRDFEQFDIPTRDLDALGVTQREINMAMQLVDGMTARWEPDTYRDEYREQLLSLIDRKSAQQRAAEKERIQTERAQERQARRTESEAREESAEDESTSDLAELLRRSMDQQPPAP